MVTDRNIRFYLGIEDGHLGLPQDHSFMSRSPIETRSRELQTPVLLEVRVHSLMT